VIRWALLIAAAVILAGSCQIGRPGYSPDEEFTEFAVRGIQAHGVPRLPSGLLYDRGLAYSYASTVLDGRVVSLLSAALSVVLTFVLVNRHAGPTAAILAAVLLATSVPFWATATSARFYAPFLALALGTLVTLSNPTLGTPGTRGTLGTMVVAAMFARWTHELAFLFAVVPFVFLMLDAGQRRKWSRALLACLAGLGLGQLLLFALHAFDPPSGETMVRRFFLWQVLNLFEQPGDRQFGVAFVVMVIGVLLAPRRAWWWVVSALAVAAMIVAFSIARASNSEPLSLALVITVCAEGSRYPLDMFWHIARTTPLTLGLALAALAARTAGVGPFGAREWRPAERAAHLLWIGWVVWFGVIDSGITTNYLLLPVSFMLIAIAVDIAALVTGGAKAPPRRTAPVAVAALLLVAGVGLDQWRGDGGPMARLEAARPTINVAGIEEIRNSLQPSDRVVCTDELGCLMLVGRIDRWLALDEFVRERFLVRRANDALTGVYTGVPAVLRPAEVFSPNRDGTLPDRTIVVDVFKDYPIGNSRDWLVRAIAEDGLTVVPLLATPQARVLQVSPPERLAALRPR
jgi:hypothetical protein